MAVEYIQHYGTDEMIARSARVSTASDTLDQGKIAGLINYLVQEGHTSTLEHCGMTVRLEVPLFVATQILRHRTGSYNAQSGRYTQFRPEFYVPSPDRPLKNVGTSARPDLRTDNSISYLEVREDVEDAVHEAYCTYERMIEAGVANEIARIVLPQSTYTTLWMTMNLNNWFKFLHLRNGTHGHPQYEIVDVADQIEALISEHFPIAYYAWLTAG